VLTHRDTTMLERCANAAFGRIFPTANSHHMTDFYSGWANQRGDFCGQPVPSRVDVAQDVVRAILNELKQVDEGMVKAANALNFVRIPTPKRKAAIFRAMIDQVLREGE